MAKLREGGESSQALFKLKCSIHLDDFNVRKITQVEQQAALARTLETLKIDARYFRNAHTRSHFHDHSP